jgi:ribose transport system ATP-binding protein
VRIAGVPRSLNPGALVSGGVGLVSEDRKGEGLAQEQSIADNLTLSRLAPYRWVGLLNLQARDRAVRGWIDRLSIRASSARQKVAELSGGNQQKVALARVLHQEAEVLLLDEPTRGIDVATKAEIYRLMGQSAAAGRAVIFVSSYFHELVEVCDRVAVMARGRLREIRPADRWTGQSLLHAAIGLEGQGA